MLEASSLKLFEEFLQAKPNFFWETVLRSLESREIGRPERVT